MRVIFYQPSGIAYRQEMAVMNLDNWVWWLHDKHCNLQVRGQVYLCPPFLLEKRLTTKKTFIPSTCFFVVPSVWTCRDFFSKDWTLCSVSVQPSSESSTPCLSLWSFVLRMYVVRSFILIFIILDVINMQNISFSDDFSYNDHNSTLSSWLQKYLFDDLFFKLKNLIETEIRNFFYN